MTREQAQQKLQEYQDKYREARDTMKQVEGAIIAIRDLLQNWEDDDGDGRKRTTD